MKSPQKLNIELPYDPAAPLLTYPVEMKYVRAKAAPLCCSTIQNGDGRWMENTYDIYVYMNIYEWHLALKLNEILCLEDFILKKISQMQKEEYYVISFIRGL